VGNPTQKSLEIYINASSFTVEAAFLGNLTSYCLENLTSCAVFLLKTWKFRGASCSGVLGSKTHCG